MGLMLPLPANCGALGPSRLAFPAAATPPSTCLWLAATTTTSSRAERWGGPLAASSSRLAVVPAAAQPLVHHPPAAATRPPATLTATRMAAPALGLQGRSWGTAMEETRVGDSCSMRSACRGWTPHPRAARQGCGGVNSATVQVHVRFAPLPAPFLRVARADRLVTHNDLLPARTCPADGGGGDGRKGGKGGEGGDRAQARAARRLQALAALQKRNKGGSKRRQRQSR